MRAALFDLDGTLVDSRLDLAASGNAVRRHFGYETLPVAEVTAMVGDGLRQLLRRLLPDTTDLDSAAAVFAAHYDQQCVRQTTAYAGINRAVGQLFDAGWRCAVVSNKPDRWCRQIIEACGLGPYFSVIRGGDGPRKPAPDPLLLVCDELGVLPARSVMIGDLFNDMAAAHAAGMAAMCVEWGFAAADQRAGWPADRLVSHPSDLPRLLNELVPHP